MPNTSGVKGRKNFLDKTFTDISQLTQSESFSGTSSIYEQDGFSSPTNISSPGLHTLDIRFHSDQSYSAITDKYSNSEHIHVFDDDKAGIDVTEKQPLDRVELEKIALPDQDLPRGDVIDDDVLDKPRLEETISDNDLLNEPQNSTYRPDNGQSINSSSDLDKDGNVETNHTSRQVPVILDPRKIRYRGFQTYSEAIEFIGKVPVVEPRPVDETSDTASRLELDLLYDSICNARNEAYKEKMKKKKKKSSTLKRLFLSLFPCLRRNKIEDADDDIASSIIIV